MGLSELLSVVTPVSRPGMLAHIAPSVPRDAEWILVSDGPMDAPVGLRPHTWIEGPATGRWGDVQRQVGLQAATRPFVTFLDDDNLMLPLLGDLVIPALEASRSAGALFGLVTVASGRHYVWPPPARVERSQVDTAMLLCRTAAARSVGWPDLDDGRHPGLAGQRCGDYVFIRELDERVGLLRLPLVAGFHDGVATVQQHAPELHAALAAGEDVDDRLLGLVHGHMVQADAPPWWKGRVAATRAPSPPVEGPAAPALLELSVGAIEGSSVPAQQEHFQQLVRRVAGARPGQPIQVLEIGLNAGLGTAAFLEAASNVHVVSLDLGSHPYVAACAGHLRARYPDRLHVVFGDSTQTLPRVAAEIGPRADLVLIDGGHDDVTCRADILNARAAAAPGALVIVDDLMPHKPWGIGVTRQWEALLDEGVLVDPEIWRALPDGTPAQPDAGQSAESAARRWGIARYA